MSTYFIYDKSSMIWILKKPRLHLVEARSTVVDWNF